MIIREACLGDFGQILELYSQLHSEDPAISDGRNVSLFESIISSEHLFSFVGVIDAKIVATCYLNLIPNLTRNASPYGIIENVVTEH